jgi:hypothetical protein
MPKPIAEEEKNALTISWLWRAVDFVAEQEHLCNQQHERNDERSKDEAKSVPVIGARGNLALGQQLIFFVPHFLQSRLNAVGQSGGLARDANFHFIGGSAGDASIQRLINEGLERINIGRNLVEFLLAD